MIFAIDGAIINVLNSSFCDTNNVFAQDILCLCFNSDPTEFFWF